MLASALRMAARMEEKEVLIEEMTIDRQCVEEFVIRLDDVIGDSRLEYIPVCPGLQDSHHVRMIAVRGQDQDGRAREAHQEGEDRRLGGVRGKEDHAAGAGLRIGVGDPGTQDSEQQHR